MLHRTDVTIGAGQGARQASLELVTAGYFHLLQLTPAAGRCFTSAQDRGADADPVLVLSHAFWQREFGSDPTAVGRDLLVEGKRFTIVGVAPRGFAGARRDRADLWAPPGALGRDLFGDDWVTTSDWYRFELIARLSLDATDTHADAQATAVIQASLPARLEPATARALYERAMERLAVISGVQRVALSGGSLRLRTGRSRSMTPEGMTDADVKGRAEILAG